MRKESLFMRVLPVVSAVIFLSVLSSCKSVPEPEGLLPPQTFADEDSRYIMVDGVNIHYKEFGNGRPELLMLHGFLGSLDGWNYIIPELSSDHRIAAYDRLAFGLTGRPEITGEYNPYPPEKAEERALKLIEELDFDKPVLVGHSAGGNLALSLALKNPGSYSALILISPAIYNNGPPGVVRFFLGLGIFERVGLNTVRGLPDQFDEFLAQAYYRPENVPARVIESYKKPLKADNWDRALWEYTKAQKGSDMNRRLEEIDLPVLIIHGREDEVVPVKDSVRAAAELPDSRLLILEECGHVAYEEKPEQTIAAIKDFLSAVTARQ
jgi:pimeloyl-ACP methyl ester carboxylesterase